MGSLPTSSSTQERDYSASVVFHPTQGKKANKTVDIGQNGTSLSANIYGQRMLQMVNDGNQGFGLCIANIGPRVAIDLVDMHTAGFRFDTECGAAVRYVVSVDEKGRLSQRAHIINTTNEEVRIAFRVNLEASVHRASYGQLTEGGPIPLPQCENALEVNGDEGSFVIRNKFLGAHLSGQLDLDGASMPLVGLKDVTLPGLLKDSSTTYQSLSIAPNSNLSVGLTLYLSPGLEEIRCSPGLGDLKLRNPGSRLTWSNPEKVETYLIRRNVDYILGNCALSISESEWRLLLLARRNLKSLVLPDAYNQYKGLLDRTLKGHLEWVFYRAERPHKFWHRSYVITGKPKDGPVYQLDQQCYPILELCDYFSEYPTEVEFVEKILSSQVVTEILDHITSTRDSCTGLFPTDETPGDDEVIYPFHFSSHVLLWYTLRRLADLLRLVPAASRSLEDRTRTLAEEIRSRTMQNFLIEGSASTSIKIAYLVDGHGKHTFYHDGNDIPTAFAAPWGFFSSQRELDAWCNTMNYALSEENELGYSSGGLFAGLGSVHSQGPWPLGYFQEMLYADVRGDRRAKNHALHRITGAMQWDGTFGEAVDVKTGETTSKAWFSWPGAMIATAIIESRQETRF
ncbi:Six-hairpin glycosidase-like protein [Mariannaea sp. PMI_226]|nr:Six-hairpin glycosidase-like protein [Mariannaea sp. PMI_226]